MSLDLAIAMETKAVQDSKGRDTYTVTKLGEYDRNVYEVLCNYNDKISEMSNGSTITLDRDEVEDILEQLKDQDEYDTRTDREDNEITDTIAVLEDILQEGGAYYEFNLWF